MRGWLRTFVTGGDPIRGVEVDDDHRALVVLLERQQQQARNAFAATVVALLVFGGGAYLLLTQEDKDTWGAIVGILATFVGAAGTRWWTVRTARRGDDLRVLELGSVFTHKPEILRNMLTERAIHAFLQNLLRTALRPDLGDSLWQQAVRPLVEPIRANRYRVGQRYTLALERLERPLAVPVSGGAPLELPASEYELMRTEIVYRRVFERDAQDLWVALVFNPETAPEWFGRSDVEICLREYAPFRREIVERLCGVDDPGARLAMVRALCDPAVSVASVRLEPDRVDVDPKGLAVRFPFSREVRDRIRDDPWARLRAALAFPLPVTVSAFPFVIAQPTQGAEIRFDFSSSRVENPHTDMFFSVHDPFRVDRVEADQGVLRVRTDPDEWVFPGGGLVFSWVPA